MYNSILFLTLHSICGRKRDFLDEYPTFLSILEKLNAKKFARKEAHTTHPVELIAEVTAHISEQASRAFQKISLGCLEPQP